MKVRIRRSNKEDLENVFECHKKCFPTSEHWYKPTFQPFIESGFVVETIETKEIIGFLLQGAILPCEQSEADNFEPLNKSGIIFKEQNLHIENSKGIGMICIVPEYRNKGLAKKLIELHFQDNKGEVVCLHTRKSNPAYSLYLKMGYEHIATIKNKYYFPDEDSNFMIKQN